jgi:peptide/nickel transport system permease protein
MSSNATATLGTMIYWANQHQAMLAGRWLWVGSPVVAIALIFISLFLTMTGYQQYSALRRGK